MLTELEMRILKLVYRICCKFFVIPFAWENGRMGLKEKQSRLGNCIVWALLLYTISHMLSNISAIVGKKDVNASILAGILFIYSAAHLAYKLNLWLFKEKLVQVINESLMTNSTWGDQFLIGQFTIAKKREKGTAVAFLSCINALVMALLLRIGTRNEVYSIYGQIRNDYHWTTSIMALLLYAALESILILDLGIQLFMNLYTLIFCCFTMKFWLNKTCIEWPKCGFASEATRIYRCILHYRRIYMISVDFNSCFGKLLIPAIKVVIIVLFVICFSALVRLHRELDSLSLAMVTAAAFTCFALLAPTSMVMSSLYNTSVQLSRNLTAKIVQVQDLNARKLYELELKSCPLIRCQVGNLYHMESKAKLTILHNVVNGVVFFLVNVKN